LTVTTLGHEGAIAFGPDQAWRVDALAIEARDTTGAGDTFAGVFAAALDAGASVADALARASVAGGLACREIGAQQSMPSTAMIEARLGDIDPASPARRDDT
jgi:ribokinase